MTVTHDAELAKRTRRVVHMADGRILDGSLDANAAADAEAGTPAVPSLPLEVAVGSDVAAAEASEGAGA